MTGADMELKTERLVITCFTADMARSVYEDSRDEDTRRFVPDEVFGSEDEAAETVRFLMSRYDGNEGPFVYPVLLRDGNESIGYVQLVPAGEGAWETGYHIAKRHTGNGYATEAVNAFLPVICARLGIKEVYGIALKENAASVRVLRKCGFETLYTGPGEYQGETRCIVKMIRRMD